MHYSSHNSNWSTVLHLFNEHDKLQRYLTSNYFDLEEQFVDQKALLKVSKPWSRSEKFVLKLALHLYGGTVKIDLNDIDYLDANNKKLVFEAFCIRFK